MHRETTSRRWAALGLAVLVGLAGAARAADPAAPPASTPPAQADEVDADALALVNRFGAFLAAQPRFGFELELSYEVQQQDEQRLEFGSFRRYTVRRPDHLRVDELRRSGGARELYFDGDQLTVWVPDEKAYALAKLAKHRDLDETLDLVRDALDIAVPLGDLLRSDPTARLEEHMVSAYVVGRENLAGVACDHVAWRTDEVDGELWIAAGERPLAQRVVIHYRDLDGQPRFSAQFRSWTFEPEAADATFRFAPPGDAERVRFSVRGRDVQPKETSTP